MGEKINIYTTELDILVIDVDFTVEWGFTP